MGAGRWHGIAALGAAALLAVFGCGTDPLAARKSSDLEQALHGHWSSTRELDLATGAGPWDTAEATERWGAEIDRYIDARSKPGAWSEMAGERAWRTRSQAPATGTIEVETWSADQPDAVSMVELRFDTDRTTLLERLPPKSGRAVVREWIYVNDQAHP